LCAFSAIINAMITSKKIMKASEVARLLNVSPNTVLNWAKSGLIPCVKIGRTIRFYSQEIEEIKKSKYLGA